MSRLTRRSLLAAALLRAAPPKSYRVAVIGNTGHGNYGHGLDTVWTTLDRTPVAAVADPNPAGLAAAAKRTRAARTYSDYREMLRNEKPDIVAVGPRSLNEREAMILAAVEARAHIFTEKPFARDPAEADRIVAAARKHNLKLQVAHQMRVSPYMLRAKAILDSGELGQLQEIRTRGKEDRRAGGEDLMVLGTHLFDMMRFFLGDPHWVTAHVTSNGRDITPADTREATEALGRIAGAQIDATFAFANGLHAHFATRATPHTDPLRFGMWLYASKGVLFLPMAIYPDGGLWILRSPSWLPGAKAHWESVTLDPAPPEHANTLMASDLLQAIEQNSKPVCNEDDGRWTIEMVHGIYHAQRAAARVPFPLKERKHALAAP